MSKVRQELVRMDAEVKQRRREKELQAQEQQAQEQRQAEEQQRLLLAQRQLQELFTSNLFTTLPPPNLPSLPTSYISFPSFPSIKSPLEEILDLTVPNSSSQVSTQADLGVDNLSRQPDPTVDNFNLEEFIQEQPQQESLAIQECNSARDSDLLEVLRSLNSFITPPSQIASSSSDAPLSVPMVFSNSFSSSLSNFTPSLTAIFLIARLSPLYRPADAPFTQQPLQFWSHHKHTRGVEQHDASWNRSTPVHH